MTPPSLQVEVEDCDRQAAAEYNAAAIEALLDPSSDPMALLVQAFAHHRLAAKREAIEQAETMLRVRAATLRTERGRMAACWHERDATMVSNELVGWANELQHRVRTLLTKDQSS